MWRERIVTLFCQGKHFISCLIYSRCVQVEAHTHTHTHSQSQQILKHLFTKLQSFQGHQDLKNKRHFRRFPTLNLWKNKQYQNPFVSLQNPLLCDFSCILWWGEQHDKSYSRMACCSLPVQPYTRPGVDLMLHSFLWETIVFQGISLGWGSRMLVFALFCNPEMPLEIACQHSINFRQMFLEWLIMVKWTCYEKSFDWHDTFMTHTQGQKRRCNFILEIEHTVLHGMEIFYEFSNVQMPGSKNHNSVWMNTKLYPADKCESALCVYISWVVR